MKIFLVRHGESEFNANAESAKIIPDHDIALTKLGRAQAESAGEALEDIFNIMHIDKNKVRMWVSPYRRTRETAKYINETLKLWDSQIREDDMLIEVNFGLFDGLSKDEIKAKFPNEYSKYEKDRLKMGKFYARRPNGEASLDVEVRLRIFFDTIYRDLNNGGPDTLIIVCHGGVMNVFIKAFLHKSHEWYFEQKNPSNCSIIEIDSEVGEYRYIYGGPEVN